jgi:hypothetical protein
MWVPRVGTVTGGWRAGGGRGGSYVFLVHKDVGNWGDVEDDNDHQVKEYDALYDDDNEAREPLLL